MAQKKKSQRNPKEQKSFRKKFGVIALILALVLFFIINNFVNKESEPEVKYYQFTKEGELVFSDSLGNMKVKIDIEIADNEYKRQLGLMNRKSMEENQGMLFIFNEERLRSFWMLNTLISLDIIFINKDKRIVTIHKYTTPLSQQSYPSTDSSIYVVEVVGGFCDKYNIIEGDKISWMGMRLGNP
ncbi:MAG: DUF192 domain-containing protein [Ignavibacteriaceae bacterium]